ncbi:MAG: tRNA (adenosine(37)-N6)-dimethylallyltransferase MiaA [Phycisphaeraceae bacterium]|nr:tRNA (adenosine(37)-N6)-dimethylallyltransferase MiaA [Phycisphaeraceae bacterium]
MFPLLCGPTASGKSALAVDLALALPAHALPPGEVISADAFQVYRAMDIGTAKPTAAERRGVPHHLIDTVEPTEPFSAHDWLARATAAIEELRTQGRTPIVVGGTHLYIKALLDGLFDGPGADPALRERLSAIDPAARRAELERLDPAAAARIHPNDARRTIRALEVFHLTGQPISAHQSQWDRSPRTDRLLVALQWPVEALNRRINSRVRDMLDRGLLEEARALHESGRLGPQAREALGYKQLIAHLEGRCTLDEAIERIKIDTRRFGKSQRTWIRRLGATPGAISLDPSTHSTSEMIESIVLAMRSPRA